MIDFIIHDKNGKILRFGQVQSAVNQAIDEGEFCIFIKANPDREYIENGKPVEIPPRPAFGFVFDYDLKKWVDVGDYSEIRLIRDRLLSETDWTQLPDVPTETKEKWQPYRQALRDVTSQNNFPAIVDWPVKPT